MSEQSELERRYRRLLSWYPRDHREQHGEEMLGVLLGAGGERTRPSRKETTDLLRGAARLHVRRAVGADGGLDRRSVLAVVSLLGPLMMLAGSASVMDQVADWFQVGFLNVTPDMPVWAIWTVVAALSLLRLRRMAAAGAWLGTAAFVIAAAQDSAPFFWYSMLLWSGWILLGVVVAAALTWSPGPALGWELVGGRRVAVLVAAVGISVVLVMKSLGTFSVLYVPIRDSTLVFGDRFTLWVLAVVVLTAGGLVAAGMGTREGRRVALVLCVPVVVSVLLLVVPGGADETLVAALSYGVPVVLLVALGGIPRRGHTRTRA